MSIAAVPNVSGLGQRKSWLLIFNCQATGLGNSLNLLSQDIEVEFFDPEGFRQHADAIISRLDNYDRVLVAAGVEVNLGIGLGSRENVWRIPELLFDAYHPDFCYLLSNGNVLKGGPLGGYQSIIAYSAYQCGLSEKQALELYCEDIYGALGYFDVWDQARENFVGIFRQHGWDINQEFIEWCRHGPFMYSINHPKISCLRDIAKVVLKRAGLEINDTDILPHDNLALGPIFPVYPEIGAKLGIQGNYVFKRGGGYQCMQLEEFVSASFELYRNSAGLSTYPLHESQIEKAISVIGAFK